MVLKLFTFLIILRFSIVTSDQILPPIFKLDDYIICLETSDSYCKVNVILKNSKFENNTLWNVINDSMNDMHSYDRSIIHRGICVPKGETLNLECVKKFAELRINKELDGTNLLARIDNIICTTKRDKIEISFYDKLFLFSLAAYVSLILYATVYDTQIRTSTDGGNRNKIILSLSLTSNWKKICNIDGNEDYMNLKSVQGIRFYNMLLIICLHTLMNFSITYISNTDYTEKLLSTTVFRIFKTLGVFLVQTFFLISSFVVTFQIYNIYKNHGQFTIKQALIIIINRFFRLGVCSNVMLLVLKLLSNFAEGPLVFDTSYIFQETCKQYWLQTFFFINNYLKFLDICHGPTWYLSVDFQLYVMATITIYIILKFKLEEFKIVSLLIMFSYLLYGCIIYASGMDTVFRLTVNTMRLYVFLRSESARILYTSTYSSWITSLVGILLGITYTKYKNRNFVKNKVRSMLWLLIFFGLPSGAIFISILEFKGFQAAVLGPFVKLLFSLGIGIGILGMSRNMGGPIRRICENKYVVLMSNFSYATYIFQTIVLYKGIGVYSLMEIKCSEMIKSFLFFDAPVSLIVGMICTLVFEQPGINLQKLFLPQISRGQRQRQKDQ